jgi:hypothetical protein
LLVTADPSGARPTGRASLRSPAAGAGMIPASGADCDVWLCFFLAMVRVSTGSFSKHHKGWMQVAALFCWSAERGRRNYKKHDGRKVPYGGREMGGKS